jgi:hypothetical protein
LARALLRTKVPTTYSPRALVLALAGVGAEITIFVSLGMNAPQALAGGAVLATALILTFREKATLVMMGSGALLGPLCESLPIYAGAWWYAAPADIFGGLVGHASQASGALLAGGGKG